MKAPYIHRGYVANLNLTAFLFEDLEDSNGVTCGDLTEFN